MTALEIVFWTSLGLVVYSQIGYLLMLRPPRLLRGRRGAGGDTRAGWPTAVWVSLIVAAHDEEEVIAAKVANALALDYPRQSSRSIVASDGSTDATAERARAAGADLVLELPRGGKVAAQNAAVARASGRAARLLRRQQRLGAATR